MIRSLKQRLRRMEVTVQRIGEIRSTVAQREQIAQAAEEAWLAFDEVGSRIGPDDAANDATRRVYNMLVQMDEATCRSNREEEI